MLVCDFGPILVSVVVSSVVDVSIIAKSQDESSQSILSAVKNPHAFYNCICYAI
jgi:hypothetical protein